MKLVRVTLYSQLLIVVISDVCLGYVSSSHLSKKVFPGRKRLSHQTQNPGMSQFGEWACTI